MIKPLTSIPWKYEAPPADAYTDPDIMLDADVHFWIISTVEPEEVVANVLGTIADKGEAIARLIAAAPELLDLAHAVVTAFEDLALPDHTQKHLLDGARAVIRKAEGL